MNRHHLGLLTLALLNCNAFAQGVAGLVSTDSNGIRSSYQSCLDSAGGVTPSMHECIDTEYVYQDKRLNQAYKSLMNKLDASGRARLRAEERRWIAHRDRSCAATGDRGQAQQLQSDDCALEKTANRATELEGRLR